MKTNHLLTGAAVAVVLAFTTPAQAQLLGRGGLTGGLNGTLGGTLSGGAIFKAEPVNWICD